MDVDNVSGLTTVVTTTNRKSNENSDLGLYLNIDSGNNCDEANNNNINNNINYNDKNNNNCSSNNSINNSNGYNYLLSYIKCNAINGNGNSGNTGINKTKNNYNNIISPRNNCSNYNNDSDNNCNNNNQNNNQYYHSINKNINNSNINNSNNIINYNYNIYKDEINEENENYEVQSNYIDIDLISDNPFKNYFQVKRYYNENGLIEIKNIIVKVQKRNNKSIKELNVLERLSSSNYSISLYGSYKGKSKTMKPRLLEYRDELLFIEMQDMAKYQTLEMIIKRRKCRGSLTMARFIMRGILASAFYFENLQIIHQTLQPSNIFILEDSLGTNDQSVVKFSNFEHCLLYSDINDRFVMGKDSVVHSIYSDRHQSRNLFKVVGENTISFTIGIIYLELLISTVYDSSINEEDYYNAFKEIIRNGKLDIINNKFQNNNNQNKNNNHDQNININNNMNNVQNNNNKNLKYLKLSQNHQIEINEQFEEDLKLISILIQDQNKRPNIKQFIIDHLV